MCRDFLGGPGIKLIGVNISAKRGNGMTSKEAVYLGVDKVVLEVLQMREEELTQSAKVVEDFGADMLHLIEICHLLKEEFDIYISNDQFDEVFNNELTMEGLYSFVGKVCSNN